MSNVLDIIAAAEATQPAGPLVPMPPDLADYVDNEDGTIANAQWSITTVQSADWAFARLSELKEQAAQIEAMKAAAIRRIEAKAEAMLARVAKGVSFFEFKILDYGTRNRKELLGGGKKKSREFLHGVIGWRTKNKGGRLVVSDPAALEEWLVLQPVEAGLYRQTIAPELKALQARFRADGVIPPGCKVEEEIDEPYVTCDAPETALAKE